MSLNIYQLAAHTSCISDPKRKSVVQVLLFEDLSRVSQEPQQPRPTAFLNGTRQAHNTFRAGLSSSLIGRCHMMLASVSPHLWEQLLDDRGGDTTQTRHDDVDRRSPKLGFGYNETLCSNCYQVQGVWTTAEGPRASRGCRRHPR